MSKKDLFPKGFGGKWNNFSNVFESTFDRTRFHIGIAFRTTSITLDKQDAKILFKQLGKFLGREAFEDDKDDSESSS